MLEFRAICCHWPGVGCQVKLHTARFPDIGNARNIGNMRDIRNVVAFLVQIEDQGLDTRDYA